jgi:hypothetical protein
LAWFMSVWRKPAARIKIRGDKRSPYLTPILQWNVFPGTPFNRTEEIPKLKMHFIHLSQRTPKPLAFIKASIVSCSILSKAFSKSNFRMTISFLDWWQSCRYSRVQVEQSWLVLVLIKPCWFLWMILITFFLLFARNFVRNLMEQFSKEIGL